MPMTSFRLWLDLRRKGSCCCAGMRRGVGGRGLSSDFERACVFFFVIEAAAADDRPTAAGVVVAGRVP